jgi:hypothetical protein
MDRGLSSSSGRGPPSSVLAFQKRNNRSNRRIASLPPTQINTLQNFANNLNAAITASTSMESLLLELEAQREEEDTSVVKERRCKSENFEHSWDYSPFFFSDKDNGESIPLLSCSSFFPSIPRSFLTILSTFLFSPFL